MHPRVVREGWVEARSPGVVVLRDPDRGEVTLLGVAADLYDLADGTRPARELAALVQADLEDIFVALDELADHGLLAARVAPPAGPRPHTRREVLRTLAAAAAAAALPGGLAHAAPDKPPADKLAPLAEQDETLLAARPPREHVHKEASYKGEHQRKLRSVAWSAQDEQAAAPLLAEQNKKAEADLVRAYEEAAKLAASPDEAKQKQLVDAPADLAALAESQRKLQVEPLRAEEQAAKAAAHKGEQALKLGALAEPARQLEARERRAKLRGELGEAAERDEKALVAAQEQRRKAAPVVPDDPALWQARERRRKAEAAEARAEEQAEKDVRRAAEQHRKAARDAGRPLGAEEQRRKAEARDAAIQQAQERREKLQATRDEQHVKLRADLGRKADEQAQKALVDKSAEQQHKLGRAEQQHKDNAVDVELRAAEHAAKSSVKADLQAK